jgi:CHRD domain
MSFYRSTLLRILLVSFIALTACDKLSSDITKATAVLSGASEVPSNSSTAAGEADVAIDIKNNKLTWTITYSGLSGVITGAHFHGPAESGVNADVAIPIEGDMLSPIKGEIAISNEQKTQLLEGKWYINLHTEANPEGEIRGQVVVKP